MQCRVILTLVSCTCMCMHWHDTLVCRLYWVQTQISVKNNRQTKNLLCVQMQMEDMAALHMCADGLRTCVQMCCIVDTMCGRLACAHRRRWGTWVHWWSDAMRVRADGPRMQTLWTQMSINKKSTYFVCAGGRGWGTWTRCVCVRMDCVCRTGRCR